MTGSFVLENKKGEVVRTLNWESPQLYLVYLENNRRVEALPGVNQLIDDKVPFTLLGEFTKQQVKAGPVAVGGGTLRWMPEIENVPLSAQLAEEEVGTFRRSLRWTAGILIGLLLLIMLIGHFTAVPTPVEEPQRLVKIMPRPETHTPVVVVPIAHKTVRPPKVAHAVVKKHPVHKITQHNVRQKTAAPKKVAINSMGALAVLGSSSDKSAQGGGIQVDAIHVTRGPGLGGTAGSGGVQTALYAQGLVAAPLGPSAQANGVGGGYGTHGRGGGQAGYGKMSLIGSSSAFFQPMEREAVVEGGLDREQIAEVIQRHLGQIRYCYEQGLQVKPALNGRVAIKFFINGGGFVNTASISNTSLHAGDVEGCIVDHLKSWKFPEPRGGVVVKVNYPFVLKRVSQS